MLLIGLSKSVNTVFRIKSWTALISLLAILALSTVCHAQVVLDIGAGPLHLAARSRLAACANPWRGDAAELPAAHLAVVQLLLDSGAPVDPKNREGITPLQGAAACNDVEIASLLIAKGANVNNRSHQYSVLDQAIYWGPDVAKLLIESGVEVNTFVPYSGETPLIIAVKEGRIELTQMLLEAGASPNTVHRRTQWTALDYAIYYCEPELVQILQAHGAKGGGKLGKERTPRRLEPCPEFPDIDRVPSQIDTE